MKKVLFLSLLLVASGSIAALALTGKDYVVKGKPGKISGVLKAESVEWYVVNGNEKTAIHLGPAGYRDDIKLNLKENDKVTAEGFIYDNELAVTRLYHNGKEYVFRDEAGVPLWSGNGNRRGDGLRRN
ncbi:MAG: hypothetical protein JW982_10450 [Spirochaetes bacterium]|nr:hypothetical protein [Spirochaetota bacterium]